MTKKEILDFYKENMYLAAYCENCFLYGETSSSCFENNELKCRIVEKAIMEVLEKWSKEK